MEAQLHLWICNALFVKKSKYRKEEEIQNKIILHKMTFLTLGDASTPYTCVMTYDLMKSDRQEK